ncbi:MAG: peptidyl-prolyl cis-trans isomerase [Candidatus Omnitrophica bacterium]|nr:peptidyl-prolyl cis-trans isomerase [Candidatus Omnitrophota bacterium]
MKKIFKIIITLVILLMIVGLLFIRNLSSFTNDSRKTSWTDKMRLDYANLLLAKGLSASAAQAFEAYIGKSCADKKDLASICYKLGNIYIDLKDYEKALGSFYKSELLDPESGYKQDMDQKIVSALESLGLSQQAQYELDSRTSLKPAAQKNEKVAVRIGKREIANEEIDRVINGLPEQVRKGLNSDDAKLRFVREYVATEVLYEKGKKLGLDKNTNIRYAVEDFRKQLVLQELLGDEIKKELKVTPEDIDLYYKANKDKYKVAERVKVSFLELTDSAKESEISARLKQGKGEKIGQWIEKGQPVFLPNGIGGSTEAAESIFKQNKDEVVGPLKIKDKLYMFIVNQKEPQRQQEFEEVSEQVEREYRMQKEQQIIQSFLDKAIEQQEIEIFYQPKIENEKVSK